MTGMSNSFSSCSPELRTGSTSLDPDLDASPMLLRLPEPIPISLPRWHGQTGIHSDFRLREATTGFPLGLTSGCHAGQTDVAPGGHPNDRTIFPLGLPTRCHAGHTDVAPRIPPRDRCVQGSSSLASTLTPGGHDGHCGMGTRGIRGIMSQGGCQIHDGSCIEPPFQRCLRVRPDPSAALPKISCGKHDPLPDLPFHSPRHHGRSHRH